MSIQFSRRRWTRALNPRRMPTLVAYLLVLLAAFVALAPFWYLFKTSLVQTFSLSAAAGFGLPKNPTLHNYWRILTETGFLHWALNSIIFAGTVTVIKVFIDTLAGYAFAKKAFPGKHVLFIIILSTLMIPIPVTMIPNFLMISRLHLIDTYPGLILPMLAAPMGIFLMRQFIVTLPSELEDAGRIDGCSELGVFWHIILPLCTPGAAVLAVVTFMWQWTNLIWPVIVTNKETMWVLTVGLATIPRLYVTEWGLVTAAAFLSVVPIMVAFLFFQRYFIEGITAGAVKG